VTLIWQHMTYEPTLISKLGWADLIFGLWSEFIMQEVCVHVQDYMISARPDKQIHRQDSF